MISEFSGEYAWASNFSPHPVEMRGTQWRTVEHAFQAAKFFVMPLDAEHSDHVKRIFGAGSPAEAKRLGSTRSVSIRPDWDREREEFMLRLLRRKFENPELAERLRLTAPHVLVEGNKHGDRDWGAIWVKSEEGVKKVLREYPGATVWDGGAGGPWLVGRNMLGSALMVVRAELSR